MSARSSEKQPTIWHKGPLVALFAVAIAYSLVDSQFRLGPAWLPLALYFALMIPLAIVKWRGMLHATRGLAFVAVGVFTIAVIASVAELIHRLLDSRISAPNLLRDSALLWLLNIVVYSLWYWEIDGNGPHHRHTLGYQPTDFAFPQTGLGGEFSIDWLPGYIDYLFVAFNASSAFSPTDTLVLSRRAKVLMMTQSLISISTLAVLAARAINTLQ
jgi:hypothetical protein